MNHEVLKNGEGVSGWDELTNVEFAGAAPTESAPEVGDEPEEFFDRQPEWRQDRMRAEWAKMELAKLNIKELGKSANHSVEDRDNWNDAVRKGNVLERQIIMRHYDEEDMLPYLADVLGMSQGMVWQEIWKVDPEMVIRRFDDMVGMFERNESGLDGYFAPREEGVSAEQKAFIMLEDLNDCPVMNRNGDLIHSHTLEPRVLEKEFELATGRGLQVCEATTRQYLRGVAETSDTESLGRQMENLEKLGVDAKAIAGTLAAGGAIRVLESQRETLEGAGVDVDDWIRREFYRMRRNGEMGSVLNHRDEYEEYGIDVQKDFVERILARGMTHDARRNLGLLRQMGYDEQDIRAIDEARRERRRSELKIEELRVENLPEEIKQDQAALFAETDARRNSRLMKKAAAKLEQKKWEKMNQKQRIEALSEYAEAIRREYGIIMPCTMEFAPARAFERGEQDQGNSTYGQQEECLTRADNPEIQDYVERLRSIGVNDTWVRAGHVALNLNIYNDGPEVADTLAHELWHVFQSQQAYLWQKGYFDNAERPKGLFPETPGLAEYYAANVQSGMYARAEDSYEDYRAQILEQEAFRMGEAHREMVVGKKKWGLWRKK